MALQPCQEDAYAEVGWSEVLACTPRPDGTYAVRVDQSVLYPEGGGQPADRGSIAGVPVVDVQATDGGVCLTTREPVPLGDAELRVDMVRRFDHMQQHTAQHLITALAQDRFGLATTSFHLGTDTCSIDLDGPLPAAQRVALEDAVNLEVRMNRPVTHRVISIDGDRGRDLRSRGLPEGHEGPVRVVEIAGLDRNTCGGTHVSQTGELQLAHLLGTEKVRGGVRLSYVAGGRVVDRLRADTARSAALTRALKCAPGEHVESTQRLLDEVRAGARERKRLLGELAVRVGQALVGPDPARPVHLHRPEADLGVLRSIADAARDAGLTGPLLLTGGDGAGVFLLDAEPEQVQALGPGVAAALGGRGGGRGRRFQGKGTDLSGASVALLGR